MNSDFDNIIDRYNTNSAKWDEADEIYGKDLIHLGVADMDFKSPEPILKAMNKVVEHGVFGYTVLNKNYYDATVNWMKRKFHWIIEEEWIVFCPRISVAVSLIIQTLTNEGDGIIVQQPLYSPLRDAVKKNNRKLIVNSLKLEDGKYIMDFDDLEQKIDRSVKLMILCNPHNPIGRVWKKEELKKIEEICIKHNLVVISDEIHSDILYKGQKHIPLASISKAMQQRTIVCNSITKTFNVPGVIVSNIIIPNEDIRKIVEDKIDQLGIHNPNIFAVPVLETAYTQCDSWLSEAIDYIEVNYNYVKTYIHENMPKLKIIEPEGTYLVWIDCRELNLDESELKNLFMEKAKVGVYMGSVFGEEGTGFIRINIATPKENLILALEKIKEYY